MGTREAKSAKGEVDDVIFKTYSSGINTSRDPWVYNFNRNALTENMSRTIQTYNEEVDRWRRAGRDKNVDDFVVSDKRKIKWGETLKRNLQREKTTDFLQEKLRTSLYRPFTKSHLYFDRAMIERVSVFPAIFPIQETETENRIICVSGLGHDVFRCHIANRITEYKFSNSSNGGTQCFPFYTYDEDGTNRRENITDWALEQFRWHYEDDSITKWDIFHYVYGLLHHPDYRERYQANLKRELPRLPFTPEFWRFAKAGQRLSKIHVGYEDMPEYRLEFIETPDMPLNWRVEKMRFSKDKTQIVYNNFLTLAGIPPKALAYRLGNRSALEWIIDQYRVKEDKRSGIISDPNSEDDPQYIVKLIGKVITVSLETMEIVEGLPKLGISEKESVEHESYK